MKKLFALALCLSLGLTFSFAQTEKVVGEKVEMTKSTGPIMEFETMEVDYGNIIQDSDPFRYFKFTNTGDAPLVIKHAKGSCGCTVPTYPREPILPGESAEVKVRYDTKRVGPFTKTVTLTTNEDVEKRILRIKGKVDKKPAEPEAVPAAVPNVISGSSNN
ncbi:MAG: DUF1573 domain-containing protein [Bacteroidota bacterium]